MDEDRKHGAIFRLRRHFWGQNRDSKEFSGWPGPTGITFQALLIPFEEESFIKDIDVITCNPPYISSGKIKKMPSEIVNNEPLLAFDGGPFGIRILFRLADEALPLLKPGGWLCFEVGEGQGNRMKERLEKMKAFSEIQTVNNDSGRIRAILARTGKTANAK